MSLGLGAAAGYYTLGPLNEKPIPYMGMRRYWQYFERGVNLPFYDAGVVLGKADVVTFQAAVVADANAPPAAESLAGYASIVAVPSPLRDDAWDAGLDGWRDASRAVLGATLLSNGF